jgi:hypothetical protein
MKWLSWSAGALALAALIACGASANAPDDGTGTGGGGGNGDASIYDGGTDYVTDSGDGDGSSTTCGDTTSVLNCGSCGNVCAGLDASADNVRCTEEAGAAQCFFSCQGEHYDIDQDASDGCEKVDSPLENHSVATAVNLGSVSCHDDSSAQNLSGVIPSDDRVHENPSVIGFNSATGSAPDYWTIVGSGGTCDDDLNLTLTVSGSEQATCYMLNATASSGESYNCAITSGTSCSISNGSGSYNDGDTINWWVSRTCTAATPEAPTYTITGHL